MNAINNGFDAKTWKEVEESLDRMLERKDLGQTEKVQNKLIQPRIVFQVEELDLRGNRRELEQTAEAALRLQTIVNNISFGGIKEELSELSEISNLAGTLFDGFEPPEIQSVTKDFHALNEELKTLQSYGFWKVVGYGGQGGDTDVYGNTSAQDVSGPMLNGALSYSGTAATLLSAIGPAVGIATIDTGLVIPQIMIPVVIGTAIIGAFQAAAGAKGDIENNAFSEYVTDQFDSIKSQSQQELAYGSAKAYAENHEGPRWDTLLSYRLEGFMTAKGEAYNQEMESALKNMTESYTGELGARKRALSEDVGRFQAQKDSEKLNIQRDVESLVLGLEGDPNREYDLQTKEEISVMAARYQENNAIVEQYKANKIALERGEKVADEDLVTDEEYNSASAALQEVEEGINTLALNAYYKSDIAKADAEANNQLVDDIQAASKDTLSTAGYDLGKNLSEGLSSAILKFEPKIKEAVNKVSQDLFQLSLAITNFDNKYSGNRGGIGDFGKVVIDFASFSSGETAEEQTDGAQDMIGPKESSHVTSLAELKWAKWEGLDTSKLEGSLSEEEQKELDNYDGKTNPRGKAYGMSFVPYDGYAATLHWGERVLTASENRQYSNPQPTNVNVSGTFYIREEADVDKVAAAIVRKIALYNELM